MEDNEAQKEIRRIDHLLFVTLKYTRTVDIIRSIIEKCILALNHQTEDIYSHLIETKKLKDMPKVPLVRVKKLEEIYSKDKIVKDIVDYYVMLKKLINSDYRAKEEYRKNVTLVTPTYEVNIEKLKEFAVTTRDYVNYLNALCEQK
jgi:hypothetical protein